MYICVDFDGTLVDHCYPDIGKPVPGAVEWLRRWNRNGGKIILYTMRSDGNIDGRVLTEAVDYLREYRIELYGVNHNPEQAKWSKSPKVHAHVYIDDSAFGCPMIHPRGFVRPCVDWSKVGPEIEKLLVGTRKLHKPLGVAGRLQRLINKSIK